MTLKAVSSLIGSPGVVTITGTPAAGNLTNFSGAASITNGDLSGDVTTAGTLVTTIAKIRGTAVTGVTGSGSAVLATGPTLTNPIVGTQAATDNSALGASTGYVTTAVANAVAGVNPAVAVQAATIQASDTSGFTYSNGVAGIGATLTGTVNTAVTIDAFTFTAVGQRLLVKNDTQSPSGAFNGVYFLSALQTGISAPVFTRALDYDMPSDINNTGAIPVVSGTANGSTSWLLTSSVVTVGVSPLTYTQFSLKPITNGAYASKPASPSTGQQYFATDLGTAGLMIIYDGTKWKPLGGVGIIYLSGVQTSLHTSDTVEATVFTYTIAAGLVSANGGLRITINGVATGTAGTKNYRVRLSTTSGSAGGTLFVDAQDSASQLSFVAIRTIVNRNSQASQVSVGNSNAGTGASTATSQTGVINMASTSYLNFDVINSNSGDASGFDSILIEWLEA